MQIMEVPSWASFKSICISGKGLPCQYSETAITYELFGPDGQFMWRLIIPKSSPASADQTDFETNYKSTFNGKLQQLDSDGAPMSRVKVAPSGWSYNLRGIEFATSTVGSLINNDVAGNSLSDATLKLYAADGTLITDQTTATASCVKTIVDVEPPFDIYVYGGNVKMASQPTDDIYVSVIGVPDVPAQYGGSKSFVQNVNLKFVDKAEGVEADGRAAKWLQYSSTLHTNKLRFQFTHPAGSALPLALFLETFKL